MGRVRTFGKVEPVQKKWLSKDEAKAYLGCSDKYLQTLRDTAQVSFSKIGGKMYFYDLASIDRLLEQNRVV